MTILLPAEAGTGEAGQPAARVAADRPPDGQAVAALARWQTEEDELFVATALADLASRHGAALRQAESAAFAGGEPPAKGLAQGIGDAFAADVENILAAAGGDAAGRPSAAAMDRLRLGADVLGRSLVQRAALNDAELHRQRQLHAATAAFDGLAGLVAADPDALAQADAHLDAIIGAAAPLFGEEAALRLHAAESARLGEAALRGLIASDPDRALERLASGAFDTRLDRDRRDRLAGHARLRRAAIAADSARAEREATAAAQRDKAARALAFEAEFGRRLAAGEATHAELAEAEAAGLVSPVRVATLRDALVRGDEQSAAGAEMAGHIAELLDRGLAPDASSPSARAAVDWHWRAAVAPALEGRPADEAIARIGDYVARTRILPNPALGFLISALFEGDADSRAGAAQALSAGVAADPHSAAPVPGPLLHRARQAAALAAAGLPARLSVRPLDDIADELQDLVSVAGDADESQTPSSGGSGPETGGATGEAAVAGTPESPPPAASEAAHEFPDPASISADELFRLLRERLRWREGGLANVEGDDGGETNRGMSQRELNRLRARREWAHLPARSFDLTDAQITEIFRKEYFDRLHIYSLARTPGLATAAPTFAEQVFDSGIISGVEVAGRQLQRALDETLGTDLRVSNGGAAPHYDGIVGPATREAVARAVREGRIAEVNNRIVEQRRKLYSGLADRDPNKQKFENGWLKRAESFRMP